MYAPNRGTQNSSFADLFFIRAESASSDVGAVSRSQLRGEMAVVIVACAALQNPVDQQEQTPSRNEVLARCRGLREISKQHRFAIMKLISRDALLRRAVWPLWQASSSIGWKSSPWHPISRFIRVPATVPRYAGSAHFGRDPMRPSCLIVERRSVAREGGRGHR